MSFDCVVTRRVGLGAPHHRFISLNINHIIHSTTIHLHPTRFLLSSKVSATAIIISAALVGIAWALLQFLLITRIPVRSEGISDSTGLVSGSNDEATTRRLNEIYTAIYEGAESFLRAEYMMCAWFVLVFSVIIFVLVSWGTGWDFARGTFTALSFILGACTSIRKCCFGGREERLGACSHLVPNIYTTVTCG